MQIKICGVNSPAAFDAAAAAGADFVGFVFCAASPRQVSPGQAAALSARRKGGPGRVGLFVDPRDADIQATLAQLPLDALQLYAPTRRAAELRARFGLPVWRAVPVRSAGDLPNAAEAADALIIEPAPPEGAARPGGNAVQLDWGMLRQWRAPCPWFLAGGLTPENVGAAIAASAAAAVDVSSGVEAAPGHKDPARIAAFIAAARLSPTASAGL